MGLRAVIVPIKSKSDLLAFHLVPHSLSDIANYECGPDICGFISYGENVFGLLQVDGSHCLFFLAWYSPSFANFHWLEDQEIRLTKHGSKIIGAKYINEIKAESLLTC